MKVPALPWIIRPSRRLMANRRVPLTTAVAVSLVCLTQLTQAVDAADAYEVSLTASDSTTSDNRSEPLTAASEGQSPQCGDTITTSVHLRTDLTCPGDGLIVGADNVVIDLNGHTIIGGGEDGVRSLNHRNVTIKNGTIRNFNVGVRLTGSQDTDLINLQVLATRGGPLGGFMGIGLELSNTTGITVQDCTITINNRATEIAASGEDILISGTTITGSNPTPLAGTVSLSGDVTIVGSRLVFVVVEWRGKLAVEDSELIRSSIDAAATPSGEHGIYSAKLTGNTFSSSPCRFHCLSEFATNIVTIFGGSNMEFVKVRIHKNTFDGAGSAGVFVQAQASTVTDMAISGNIFSNNGHGTWIFLPLRDINGSLVNDGLHITVPPGTDITVAENQTSNNADYGIEAAPGTVIDGGGNVSSNDPSGCLGVTCA